MNLHKSENEFFILDFSKPSHRMKLYTSYFKLEPRLSESKKLSLDVLIANVKR